MVQTNIGCDQNNFGNLAQTSFVEVWDNQKDDVYQQCLVTKKENQSSS